MFTAESGIPTFRDQQSGLWENFDAAELATTAAFTRDPAFVWGWYEWRRSLVLKAQPNAGHLAIAALQSKVPHCTLITQNVDDLHERGGSCDVIHLHGELSKPYCKACRQPHTLIQALPDIHPNGARLDPPRCTHCGAKVRPGVVWFGEPLPQDQWNAARHRGRNVSRSRSYRTARASDRELHRRPPNPRERRNSSDLAPPMRL